MGHPVLKYDAIYSGSFEATILNPFPLVSMDLYRKIAKSILYTYSGFSRKSHSIVYFIVMIFDNFCFKSIYTMTDI